MQRPFVTKEISDGVWCIKDLLDNHAYLVIGSTRALLVDTMGGFGDLRTCVEGLTDLPVVVALTHGHYDHMAGAYWFGEAFLSPADSGTWDLIEDHARRVHEQVVVEGLVSGDDPFGPRDGIRPRGLPILDGDLLDLGTRTVRAVALPGHTAGSMGYLVEDERILLTGDAVTPIMCLFFKESLGIATWRETLARMRELPFDRFYTGHHDHTFTKDDLASFDEAGAFALEDRGMEWQHMRLPEYRGILHFCPSSTSDADSVDFRAVIEPWHELPPRCRRSRRQADQ